MSTPKQHNRRAPNKKATVPTINPRCAHDTHSLEHGCPNVPNDTGSTQSPIFGQLRRRRRRSNRVPRIGQSPNKHLTHDIDSDLVRFRDMDACVRHAHVLCVQGSRHTRAPRTHYTAAAVLSWALVYVRQSDFACFCARTSHARTHSPSRDFVTHPEKQQ